MSYINDREKMNKEADRHRRSVWSVIKLTFIAFGAALLIFCVALILNVAFGIGSPRDDEAPTIEGPKTVVGYIGDTPAYKQMVTVKDKVDPAPHLEVNASRVNIDVPGEYKVLYRATDESGNVSKTFTLTYVVKSKEYHIDTLMEIIADKAAELGITKEMNKKEQVRKIYAFVNAKSTIYFTDESNIPNINRNSWESDWIEEAIRTLDSGEGDCYSYYSLSKAFFEYFEIENKGIKRAENYSGAADDGTHFWSVVKVEEGWYYYDATRLAGQFSDGTKNACLITEAKLKSYVGSHGEDYFYKMVKFAGFPTIEKEALD